MNSFSKTARRIGLAVTLASTLLGLTASVAVVDAGTSVSVSVRCYSNPEKTIVKNTGTTTFKVTKVGSTYQPYSYEPFSVSKTLAPGQSVTFQTGYAASGANKLTGTYIYNDNGRDGTKVVTNVGTYTKHC
jgi:hypothetical protein